MPEILPPPTQADALSSARANVTAAAARLDACLFCLSDPSERALVQGAALDLVKAWADLAATACHHANARLAMIERRISGEILQ